MRTKNTFDLALGLYKIGCRPTEEEVLKYINLYDEDGFLWYQFTDRELEKKLGYVNRCKKNDVSISVKNIYKLEHIVGVLKQLCRSEKGRR